MERALDGERVHAHGKVLGVVFEDAEREDDGRPLLDGLADLRRPHQFIAHVSSLLSQLQTSIGPLTPICAGARFTQPSFVIAIGFSQRRPNFGEVTNVSIWNVMFGSSS